MKQLTQEYEDYIVSVEWSNKRKQAFKLLGKECQRCKIDRRLHVHHMTYVNFKNENIEKELAILCTKCHSMYHKLNRYATIRSTLDFIKGNTVFVQKRKKRLNKQPKKEKKVKNYIFGVGKLKRMKVSRVKLHSMGSSKVFDLLS